MAGNLSFSLSVIFNLLYSLSVLTSSCLTNSHLEVPSSEASYSEGRKGSPTCELTVENETDICTVEPTDCMNKRCCDRSKIEFTTCVGFTRRDGIRCMVLNLTLIDGQITSLIVTLETDEDIKANQQELCLQITGSPVAHAKDNEVTLSLFGPYVDTYLPTSVSGVLAQEHLISKRWSPDDYSPVETLPLWCPNPIIEYSSEKEILKVSFEHYEHELWHALFLCREDAKDDNCANSRKIWCFSTPRTKVSLSQPRLNGTYYLKFIVGNCSGGHPEIDHTCYSENFKFSDLPELTTKEDCVHETNMSTVFEKSGAEMRMDLIPGKMGAMVVIVGLDRCKYPVTMLIAELYKNPYTWKSCEGKSDQLLEKVYTPRANEVVINTAIGFYNLTEGHYCARLVAIHPNCNRCMTLYLNDTNYDESKLVRQATDKPFIEVSELPEPTRIGPITLGVTFAVCAVLAMVLFKVYKRKTTIPYELLLKKVYKSPVKEILYLHANEILMRNNEYWLKKLLQKDVFHAKVIDPYNHDSSTLEEIQYSAAHWWADKRDKYRRGEMFIVLVMDQATNDLIKGKRQVCSEHQLMLVNIINNELNPLSVNRRNLFIVRFKNVSKVYHFQSHRRNCDYLIPEDLATLFVDMHSPFKSVRNREKFREFWKQRLGEAYRQLEQLVSSEGNLV